MSSAAIPESQAAVRVVWGRPVAVPPGSPPAATRIRSRLSASRSSRVPSRMAHSRQAWGLIEGRQQAAPHPARRPNPPSSMRRRLRPEQLHGEKACAPQLSSATPGINDEGVGSVISEGDSRRIRCSRMTGHIPQARTTSDSSTNSKARARRSLRIPQLCFSWFGCRSARDRGGSQLLPYDCGSEDAVKESAVTVFVI